jgi:phage shock protein PspC (stress-responsive transcriptional regulator)
MKLTPEQNQRITRYLRDVDARLDGLRDDERRRVVNDTRARVRNALDALGDGEATDAHVEDALQRCGEPSSLAAAAQTRRIVKEPALLDTDDPRWLGVCGGLSEPLGGIDPFALRALALILGILTGPLAVLIYLVLYAFMYHGSPEGTVPRVEPVRLVKAAAYPFIIGVCIAVAVKGLFALLYYAYARFVDASALQLPGWDWLTTYHGDYFFLMCIVVLPFAVLGGLPLAGAWADTLRKIAHALLSLYVLVLCLGTASLITGMIIRVAENVSGVQLT